jgi:glycogen debranching enzyme
VDSERAGLHEVAVVETLAGRHARTLKHGDTFSLLDASGDIRAGSADGLYHLDTRHLSRFDLTIDGVLPILLSSTIRDDNAALTCDLTNPELPGPDGRIHSDTIHIRRTQFLWEATLHERLRIRNFGASGQRCASSFASPPILRTSSRSAERPGRAAARRGPRDRGSGRHP